MKAINHSAFATLVMILVFAGNIDDVKSATIVTCQAELIAQGASSLAEMSFNNGYCWEVPKCPKVQVKIDQLLPRGSSSDEEFDKAWAAADQACKECTFGGKPRCLIDPNYWLRSH